MFFYCRYDGKDEDHDGQPEVTITGEQVEINRAVGLQDIKNIALNGNRVIESRNVRDEYYKPVNVYFDNSIIVSDNVTKIKLRINIQRSIISNTIQLIKTN